MTVRREPPMKMTRVPEPMRVTSMRMLPALIAHADRISAECGITRSAWMREAISDAERAEEEALRARLRSLSAPERRSGRSSG